jgi:transaldolase
MQEDSYLRWLVSETETSWWHDSADPDELADGIAHGATGVTTNPVLTCTALRAQPGFWRPIVDARHATAGNRTGSRAEILMGAVVTATAANFEAVYENTGRSQGYVCAQVDPTAAADREAMAAMARRFHAWAPNIAVKLPVTAAGLDVLEDCVADGITITATVSFTVPQVVAVAERHRLGAERARRAGKIPGHCFAVIMIGRLDDYLRDAAWDSGADVSEEDIRCAGLAVSKRAHSIYMERDYAAVLLVAALRGTHHMTQLAGGRLIMSIHPKYQQMLLEPGVPRAEHIDEPISRASLRRLQAMPEFVRSYEPEGMSPEEFIRFGATQRTLAQFNEAGWALLDSLDRL